MVCRELIESRTGIDVDTRNGVLVELCWVCLTKGAVGVTWTITIEALPQIPYLVQSHDKPLLPVMVT